MSLGEEIAVDYADLRRRGMEGANWVFSGLYMLNPKYVKSSIDAVEFDVPNVLQTRVTVQSRS